MASAPLVAAIVNATANGIGIVTDLIRLDESHHGPARARRSEYVPLWILRGLSALYIEFAAAS